MAWDQLLYLTAPLPLVAVANLAERPAPEPVGSPAFPGVGFRAAPGLLGTLTWTALMLACLGVGLEGLSLLAAGLAAAGQRSGPKLYGALLLFTALAAGAFLLRGPRARLARLLPLDPDRPVHATAVVLSLLLLGSQLAARAALDLAAAQAGGGAQLGPLDLTLQELPFLLAALLGVGLFARRSPAASLQRLGLVRPQAWEVLLALSLAGLFYAFSLGAEALAHRLTPETARQVESVTRRLFGNLGSPGGIAALALSAGICEEALFRGALQPRLGILWSSLLFAAVHAQYGLSLDAAAVLVLSLCLGLLRRSTNTTAAVVCHAAYNALAAIGLGGALLLPALLGEAALWTATLAAWRLRPRLVAGPPPG